MVQLAVAVAVADSLQRGGVEQGHERGVRRLEAGYGLRVALAADQGQQLAAGGVHHADGAGLHVAAQAAGQQLVAQGVGGGLLDARVERRVHGRPAAEGVLAVAGAQLGDDLGAEARPDRLRARRGEIAGAERGPLQVNGRAEVALVVEDLPAVGAEGRGEIRVGGGVLHIEAGRGGQAAQERVGVGEGLGAGRRLQRRDARVGQKAGQHGRLDRLQLAGVEAEPELRGRLGAEDARAEFGLVQVALQQGVAVVTAGQFGGDDVAVPRLGGGAHAFIANAELRQAPGDGRGGVGGAAEEVAGDARQVEVGAAVEQRLLRGDDGRDQPGGDVAEGARLAPPVLAVDFGQQFAAAVQDAQALEGGLRLGQRVDRLAVIADDAVVAQEDDQARQGDERQKRPAEQGRQQQQALRQRVGGGRRRGDGARWRHPCARRQTLPQLLRRTGDAGVGGPGPALLAEALRGLVDGRHAGDGRLFVVKRRVGARQLVLIQREAGRQGSGQSLLRTGEAFGEVDVAA